MLAAARSAFALLTRRERAVYALLVAARALVGILDVLGILMVGVVAALGATRLSGSGSSFLGIELPDLRGSELLGLVVVVLSIFVVKAALAIGLSRALMWYIARIEARNAAALSRHLLGGTLENARRMSKAEFQFAITESTAWTFTGILANVSSIFVEGFLLVLVAAAFLVVDPVVALFALGYFALIVVGMQAGIGRILKRSGEDAAAATVETTRAVADTLDTFREIAVLGRQRLYLERLRASRTRLARSGATLSFLAGMPRYVIETALILGVVVFVGQQLLAGQLVDGLATLGVFLGGAVRIMGAILPLQTAVAALKVNAERSALARGLLTALPARERETDPAAAPAGGGATPPTTAPAAPSPLAVEVRELEYRYPDATEALAGVSLTIEPGQFVAVIGPSGAGKSTLVDVVTGLAEPSGGSVRIDGLAPAALRERRPGAVSYVPQKPGLVTGTIAENVALGIDPAEIDRERVLEVLRFAHLDDLVNGLPRGIDTPVGAQADAFSGGQIQRIGLARALYTHPGLLVLDEATSGLDAATEAVVAEGLRRLHGRTTVVVIAHRLSTVQHADQVFVVDGGRVVASGDFPTVRREVPMVAEYVRLMSFDDPA
ncbi:MAG: ABC transporter ATP-binding protein [Actinomycetales bacterium]|nr:ABC transporter ATP-binding protein [Actinomycetales bacterium]